MMTELEGRMLKTGQEEFVHNHKDEYYPELDYDLIENFVPEEIRGQFSHLMDLYEAYNKNLPIQRSEADFNFVNRFTLGFLADRAKRADEVQTPEYKKASETANKLLPMSTFMVMCMDGRVKPIHTNGFSAHVGSAIRTPGGMLQEFYRVDGPLELDPKSNFANLIRDKIRKHESIAEVFDSHWGCAARTLEESATGNHPADSGLLRDVMAKSEMVAATKRFLKREGLGKNRNLAFIQTTFNPYTGFMYMGFERQESLDHAKLVARVNAEASGEDPEEQEKYAQFDKKVVEDLIEKKSIISTGDLANDPDIKSTLEKYNFNCDWQRDYVNSAVSFWNNMEQLVTEAGPAIRERVLELYPHLSEKTPAAQKELDERVLLLLTNTYNGFLHNKSHDEKKYLNMSDHDYEEQEFYEYGHHMEKGVKVSEGGHPPYDIMMFVVYKGDLENLPGWIETASGIVRQNRARKVHPVIDPSRPDLPREKVELLPVPVIMQEIVRAENKVKLTENDWKNFSQIKWEDMPKNWDTMTEKEFTNYLIDEKGISNTEIRRSIENMRMCMSRIYEPHAQTAPHLKDLYKIVVPILCDGNRKVRGVIPFVKVGRPSKAA